MCAGPGGCHEFAQLTAVGAVLVLASMKVSVGWHVTNNMVNPYFRICVDFQDMVLKMILT